MNPNWSKLASLGRTLFILFASTFVGAIVLPVATDGTLPATWAAWRPILAVALSAAVAAEFLWIRTHLQQAAQAIGVVANDATTPAAVKAALLKGGFGVVLLMLSLLCSGCNGTGCTPAQVAQAQTDTSQAIDLTNAVCALAPDSPIGQPLVSIICTLAEGTEQLVSVVIGAVGTIEGPGGTASLNSATAIARVPVKQIEFKIPAPTAAKFLAAHTGKK
jgi:hypothetical protein